jgi:hypothetical protein
MILRKLFPEHFEFKERKQLNEDFLKVASAHGFVVTEIWENTLGTNYDLEKHVIMPSGKEGVISIILNGINTRIHYHPEQESEMIHQSTRITDDVLGLAERRMMGG